MNKDRRLRLLIQIWILIRLIRLKKGCKKGRRWFYMVKEIGENDKKLK